MPINTLEDLVFALLTEIGLGITPEGLLYDQDNGNVLQTGGMQIRASVDKFHPAIATDLYAAFDPVFDNRMMQFFLGYYLKKEEWLGNLNPLSISETIVDIPYYRAEDFVHSKPSYITVVLDGGSKCVSNTYFQKGLKYSDVILRLGGSIFCDLTKFDSIPEEAIQEVF